MQSLKRSPLFPSLLNVLTKLVNFPDYLLKGWDINSESVDGGVNRLDYLYVCAYRKWGMNSKTAGVRLRCHVHQRFYKAEDSRFMNAT